MYETGRIRFNKGNAAAAAARGSVECGPDPARVADSIRRVESSCVDTTLTRIVIHADYDVCRVRWAQHHGLRVSRYHMRDTVR